MFGDSIDEHLNKSSTNAKYTKESHNLGTDDISNCFKYSGRFDCLIYESSGVGWVYGSYLGRRSFSGGLCQERRPS